LEACYFSSAAGRGCAIVLALPLRKLRAMHPIHPSWVVEVLRPRNPFRDLKPAPNHKPKKKPLMKIKLSSGLIAALPRGEGERLWAKAQSQSHRRQECAGLFQGVLIFGPAAAGPADTAALRRSWRRRPSSSNPKSDSTSKKTPLLTASDEEPAGHRDRPRNQASHLRQTARVGAVPNGLGLWFDPNGA